MSKVKPMKIHPVASLMPEMTELEFHELKQDIKLRGLQNPILLSKDGRIVDGRHRYKACKELGIDPSYIRSKHEDDYELAREVVSLNVKRRHLNESQLAMIASKLTDLYEKAAKLRAEEGRKAGGEATKTKAKGKAKEEGLTANLQSSPRTPAHTAAEDAANAVGGVSTRLVAYANKVRKGAIEAVQKAVDKGAMRVHEAAALAKHTPTKQEKIMKAIEKGDAKNVRDAERKLTFEEQLKAIKANPPPKGIVQVLVVDPPWTFNKTREDDSTQRGRTPYPTMTTDEIKALKLPIEKDAVVWLWVTNAHLLSGEALDVLKAWGLEARGLLTWAKTKMGVGDWLRGQTEHCILATKGEGGTKFLEKPCPSTLFTAAPEQHSQKPDVFYEIVQKYCPGVKGELFSRKAREGWSQHGAELGSIPASKEKEPGSTMVMGMDSAKGPDQTVVVTVPVPAAPVPIIPPQPAGAMPPIVPNR
jgi:N6-adenosine-specific RNA methylase IME4/ParB-like chromosome segregation protein Spo0J